MRIDAGSFTMDADIDLGLDRCLECAVPSADETIRRGEAPLQGMMSKWRP